MYKVFFNDSTILIGSEMKKSLNNNIVDVFDFCDNNVVSQIVDRIDNSSVAVSFFIRTSKDFEAWQSFKHYFTEIPAAGGLVVNTGGQFLFIKRMNRWDLPKGKIEIGETAEMASIREVEEECGIFGLKTKRQLDSTFHIYRSPFLSPDRNLVLKETKWFLMEYSGNHVPVPQTEEDITEIKWFDLIDIEQVYKNTYSSLYDFLGNTLPVI